MRLTQFSNWSIKQKQMFMLALTSTIAVLLASVGFVVYETMTFRDELKRNMSNLAWRIADQNAASLQANDPVAAEARLKILVADDPEVAAVCIYRTNGTVFAKYPSNGSWTPPVMSPQRVKFCPRNMELSEELKVA